MAGTVRAGNCTGLARVGGLVPGYRYRLSAWVNTWGLDKDGWADKAKVRVGISTVGSSPPEELNCPERADGGHRLAGRRPPLARQAGLRYPLAPMRR
ncbi:MAG: hypothetical protein ACODAJ_12535 [Planctomycetota bacterium]